jgi:uncharacterized glyoxalase superfamily protein PhnB
MRYDHGAAAIDWLVAALGFETHADHRGSDGAVVHADLRFGTSVIGVSSVSASPPDSPWGGVRQGVFVRIANPDDYHDRAKAAGAEIVSPLRDMDYGSRDFSLRDPGGHFWGFGTYDTGARDGEPSLWPELRYADAAAAVSWLENAIGFRRTREIPDEHGALMHAELRLGSAVLMLGPSVSSKDGGELRQFINLRVEDPDAHFHRAKSASATIVREPWTTPYGARAYAVRDPEGFLWWVSDYAPSK